MSKELLTKEIDVMCNVYFILSDGNPHKARLGELIQELKRCLAKS